VRVGMKWTYTDGTHAIELSALGLAEKLAALIPPPRVYTVIYSGILDGGAQASREAKKRKRRDGPAPSLRAQQALSWAELLLRKHSAYPGACRVADHRAGAPVRIYPSGFQFQGSSSSTVTPGPFTLTITSAR